jgi:hydroxymethylglutaryl-CoA lyase
VLDEAKQHNLKVRGYVSCVMGCPYEGDVDPKKVNLVAEQLYQMGCYEISLGDTIGIGTPEKTHKMFQAIKNIPKEHLAAHFHDTYDRAVENILAALEVISNLKII